MRRSMLSHELRLLLRNPAIWTTLALLAAALLFGLYNGASWARFQDATLAAARADEAATFSDLKAKAVAVAQGQPASNSWRDPTNAASVGMFYARPAVLPPAPLAPLAVGQSDVYPYNLDVSGVNLASATTKAAEELENPQNLVTGRFDYAFALIVVLPLAVLALMFGLISGEREAGTLRLVMAQPVRLRALLLAKVGLRWGLVVAVTWGATLLGLALFGEAAPSMGLLLLALGVAALYAALWFALALLVEGYGRHASANALALAGLWIAFVFVLPGLLGAGAEAAHPVPSRAHLIEAARDVNTALSGQGPDIVRAYYAAHPDARPDSIDLEAPDFPFFYTAVQNEAQARVAGSLHRYQEARAAQQDFMRVAGFVVPPVLVQSVLNDLAGTGFVRHARFLDQVTDFHTAHRAYFVPRALSKTPLRAADYEAMPRFRFEEEPATSVLGRLMFPLTGLAALTLGLSALGFARVRRIQA